MQVKRIAECSNGSILQYFRLSLKYHNVIKIFLFGLFLSGRFTVAAGEIFLFLIYGFHNVHGLSFEWVLSMC